MLHADIEKKVAVDMEILAGLAQLAEMVPEYQNYRPRSIVAEFPRAMHRELDFNREVRNCSNSPATSATIRRCISPRSISNYARRRVLTMELVEGLKSSEWVQTAPPAARLEEVARRARPLPWR